MSMAEDFGREMAGWLLVVDGVLGRLELCWAEGNREWLGRLGWEAKGEIVRCRVVGLAGSCRESIDGQAATRCLQQGTPLFLIISRRKTTLRAGCDVLNDINVRR
jgi:hypothetical protein